MKRKFTKLMAALALLVFMTPSLVGWGQVSTATATNGNSYVVAYYANNTYYALPHGTSSDIWDATEVQLNSLNKVDTETAADLSWTLTEGSTTGQFYITYGTGSSKKYLIKSGTTGDNKKINVTGTSSTDNLWDFSLNTGNNNYTVKSLKSIQSGTTGASLIYLGYGSVGKYGVYNSNLAAGIILLEIGDVPTPTEPSITVGTTTVNAPETAVSTTSIQVTYNNLTNYSADVIFYESDGETSANYDHSWMTAEINASTKNLDYSITANTGAARTAYLRVYALGDEGEVESELVTITQAAKTYAINVATGLTGGTIEANPTSAAAGATISLTAHPGDAYIFDSWSVYKHGDQLTTVTVENNQFTMPAYEVDVTATFIQEGPNFTWNLATNSYVSNPAPTADLIQWTSSYATMKNEKNGGTNVNNYIPTSQSSTRFYSGNKLSLIPASNNDMRYRIIKAVFTATTENYATAFANSNWTNATASANNTEVTVTPTNGANTISAIIGGTCGFTQVKVYYGELIKSNITIDSDITNGTVSITGNLTEAWEGTTISISASPDEGCILHNWDVYKTDDSETKVTVTDNQFIMPAYAVTVSASMGIPYEYTVSYSVNGAIQNSQTVTEGNSASLITSPEGIPSGHTFYGWSMSPSSTSVVSSYKPTGDATLYAVFYPTSAPILYQKVTSDLGTDWAGDYLIAYSNTVFADGRVGGTGTGGIGAGNQKVNLSQNISNNGTILASVGDTYNVTLEEITSGSNTYVLKTKDGNYNYYTKNDNGLSSTSTKSTAAAYPISVTFTSESNIKLALGGAATGAVFRYNAGTGNTPTSYFRFYKDGGQNPVYLYKRTNPIAYTLIKEISSAETMDNVYSTYLITVKNGGVLTLTGDASNGDETNLVIEDGGKLVTHNAVQATVKKNIEAAGNWGNATTYTPDGWYFIASPVDDAAFPTGSVADQDIYQLDWANNKWLNLQISDHSTLNNNGFQRGIGYLYASKDGNTISVAGEIQPLSNDNNATVTLANDGWNLIGNPLTCKVTVSAAFSELNNGSAVTNQISGSTINPFQGIVVYGNAGTTVTFTKAESQNAIAPGSSALQMTVAQNIVTRGNTTSTTVDNAVISFNEGSVLPKFTMLESNANLYIPQGTEEYAIAYSNGQGEMPVNFRANENGTYTLTVNPENVEMNYLHLIDNMTGTDIDLLATPSYTFTAKTTDYESRFKLVFAANTAIEDNSNETFAFFANGQLIVSNEGEATLQVIDIMGRILNSETVNGSVSKAINQPAGIYMIRLINGNDVKVQKMIVR